MTDPFARQTAQHAHTRLHQLEAELARLRTHTHQRALSDRRCHLCGDPIKKGSRYCHSHSWAAGV